MARSARPAHRGSTDRSAVLGTMGFVAEIAVFASVGVAVFRAADAGPGGAVIAATAVVAMVILWAVAMEPGSSHRLPVAGRVVLVLAAGVAAAAALAASGGMVWPALTGVATLVLLLTSTRPHGQAPSTHRGRHARSR